MQRSLFSTLIVAGALSVTSIALATTSMFRLRKRQEMVKWQIARAPWSRG
jgi:hypothetical protein